VQSGRQADADLSLEGSKMKKLTHLSPLAALALVLLAAACTSTPNAGWQSTPWVDDALVNDLTAQGHVALSNSPKGIYP
jgi:hypothetical protein